MRTAFIGLGQMGARMAARLADAGYALIGYDAAGTAERLPDGGTAADSVAEALAGAGVALLSLPDGSAVEAVASEIVESGWTGCVFDHSTIGPEAAVRVHGLLAEAGITYLDAPVSGGTRGAVRGTLAMMVSGESAEFERATPALKTMAKNLFYIGPAPGQGQTMKLLNNLLSGVAMVATSEVVLFGEAHGLNPKVIIDVLNVSSGQNTATSDKFPTRILNGRYDAGFTVDLLSKDVALYLAEAERIGAREKVARQVGETLAAMHDAMPGADFTRVYSYLKRLGAA
ncbi:MAG: NAD(P)-dependent oxidoreductase [Alphaproteobacteria bacterium]|jgi:3-hydroxyisobutyrate dehydrogenase|nr:NAD(P)-dependent oxidoreductase [Alphaproteobacteria bacterium]MDP7174167.1 NAD(P)-dependent oxidoreductase [Alphaproteobacteria bacterium]MDP7232520.1 NAD(P)-dependent oxidoreductase [Alphaproteobacteria bacterium]MDP7486429.1 NAD(P)-dependent oxidoreductase [Alphaproteobacteria bacterium]HJN21365.1 NAD(P)-dependent oxidoreductase [Alphaproteobacteria bacterium]|tara:strand:- start:104 stop:961 length:858 start_codon:yes stop_codon:yes gene_type:complete